MHAITYHLHEWLCNICWLLIPIDGRRGTTQLHVRLHSSESPCGVDICANLHCAVQVVWEGMPRKCALVWATQRMIMCESRCCEATRDVCNSTASADQSHCGWSAAAKYDRVRNRSCRPRLHYNTVRTRYHLFPDPARPWMSMTRCAATLLYLATVLSARRTHIPPYQISYQNHRAVRYTHVVWHERTNDQHWETERHTQYKATMHNITCGRQHGFRGHLV